MASLSAAEIRGLILGLVAVAAFSFTLPMTRLAVAHLDVWFVVLGRALGAAVLAGIALAITRETWPARHHIAPLLATSAGVVLGFPLLTSIAMKFLPASHGAVVVGLLPLMTAIAGVMLAGERPSVGFWIASVAGTAVLLAFLLEGGLAGVHLADVALVGAVVSAAIGYALGGRLAGQIGGWQVISWALVLAAPALLALAIVLWWTGAMRLTATAPLSAWVGFAYVTLISQFLGFFAWYKALALGGIARVSQVQLLQLFMTLAASAAIAGETLAPRFWVYGALVVVIAAIGTRLRARKS